MNRWILCLVCLAATWIGDEMDIQPVLTQAAPPTASQVPAPSEAAPNAPLSPLEKWMPNGASLTRPSRGRPQNVTTAIVDEMALIQKRNEDRKQLFSRCVESYADILQRLATSSSPNSFRYPLLKDAAVKIATDLFKDQQADTERFEELKRLLGQQTAPTTTPLDDPPASQPQKRD